MARKSNGQSEEARIKKLVSELTKGMPEAIVEWSQDAKYPVAVGDTEATALARAEEFGTAMIDRKSDAYKGEVKPLLIGKMAIADGQFVAVAPIRSNYASQVLLAGFSVVGQRGSVEDYAPLQNYRASMESAYSTPSTIDWTEEVSSVLDGLTLPDVPVNSQVRVYLRVNAGNVIEVVGSGPSTAGIFGGENEGDND